MVGQRDMSVKFRVIVTGDAGVGKSSIVKYLTEGKFIKDIPTTTEPVIVQKDVELKNKVKAELQIIDTAGQETFGDRSRSSYSGNAGALIVYDVTKRKYFDNVEKWLEEVKVHMPEEPIIYIVRNKIDNDNDKQQISTAESKYKAQNLKVKHFETSAKNGRNIYEVFRSLAEDISKKYKEKPEYYRGRQNSVGSLSQATDDNPESELLSMTSSNEFAYDFRDGCCHCSLC